MKKGFLITNGLAFFFGLVSIGWLIYDFIAFDFLHSKLRNIEDITPTDERLFYFIQLGLVIFLVFHVFGFIAVASQFQYFRKASVLRIIALLLGIISCLMPLVDIACLSDIANDLETGRVAELEWRVLHWIAALRGIFIFAIIANLIEAFLQRRKIRSDERAIKDEVIFTLVHCVGVFCGVVGLFFSNAAFAIRLAHPMLHFTFPFLFVLTLVPYSLLAGYWMTIKLKEKPADWYDEKQFQDSSKAGLLSLLVSIPFLALIYIFNYNAPKGPIEILWFPLYLYFVMLVFSLASLYFSWKD